ncbi:hypothetical protein ABENE_21255 [Asticcacaulis benevestitus DSM 16100 = ATCC BAA-896]|uniref:Multidrug resistance protein MdtA-like C-terminal permuted SH3 domain-containing protein n=2 Tax=Asticcacaulis TaxID=76890 RepID=V4NJG4_9CAUL|nr:hypothetical protein ABENE_21255 [Asticcacaulis benevestitus DSM 16100 = ATCC BAA-896]
MDRRVHKKTRPWWRRGATIAVGLTVVAMIAAWRFLPASGSTDIAMANIETGVVSQGRFEDYLPVRATAAPKVTTLVGVLSGGQVETLWVQDGASVTAGMPLATLANPQLKLEVMTREAEITGQLGNLSGQDLALERNRLDRAGQIDQASYDLIKAQRDLTIHRQLHEKGIVSDAALKSFVAEAAYQENRLALLQSGAAAETRITSAQVARLEDSRNRLTGSLAAVHAGLDALVVRAPVAGRLTNFTLQPGQTLKPGDPAGQIDSEDSWKLVADVDEYYLGRVSEGQSAQGDGGVRLTVAKVLPAVTNGHFRVELVFDGQPPAGLNRGQTLDVRITMGSPATALVAPTGGWLDAGGGAYAFVLDPDAQHARRRAIKVGRRNPEKIEILSGLAANERIVTSNTSSVKGDILNLR